MSQLKANSVSSNQLWKFAGKPRSGPTFQRRQACRSAYRYKLRHHEQRYRDYYSNALHDSLCAKNPNTFWRCWQSKFESKKSALTIEGTNDPDMLVNKFANYFSNLVRPNSYEKAVDFEDTFKSKMLNYIGNNCCPDDLFDVESVDDGIHKLKLGKATDLDGLSTEHLLRCHPSLVSILSKLFNLIIYFTHVPTSYCHSYTIPLLKLKDYFSKSLSCSDFRGIAISNVFSKVFEYCLLSKLSAYFVTDSRQFGFKKNTGCSNAIYAARTIVENYVNCGDTANLCTIDVSKAFDRVNHYALFTKLMDRKVPKIFLQLLVNWLPYCYTRIKWDSHFSDFFILSAGVRQGSVLAPFLFAVYINDIIRHCLSCQLGEILIYADDILLIARSVTGLQKIINVVVDQLQLLDLAINCSKSSCIRIGPRFNIACASIVSEDGIKIPWVHEIRYLGIFIVAASKFKCSFSVVKKSFCRSVNAILGKIGMHANEDVVLHLIKFKCLPVLLYASEVCTFTQADIKSFDFMVTRFLMKILKSNNRQMVLECADFFGFSLPSKLIKTRKDRFLNKLPNSNDSIYIKYSL